MQRLASPATLATPRLSYLLLLLPGGVRNFTQTLSWSRQVVSFLLLKGLAVVFFPERAPAQGSLCVFRPLGLLPGGCSRWVGGFFCRKNAVFLSRTLKNCGVLPLGLVAGGAWASRSYAYLRCLSSLCLVRVTY